MHEPRGAASGNRRLRPDGRQAGGGARRPDAVVGCYDTLAAAAESLAREHGAAACASLADLLALGPDVVVVAATHDRLAELAESALGGGAHVLVEKPAGLGTGQIDRLLDDAARPAAAA